MENKRQEYHKKYYQEHKEEIAQRKKDRYYENLENTKIKRKKFYENNKDNILVSNKKWRENNKEQFQKIVHARRRAVAEELKKQGQMYVYLPRSARENKMVVLLSNKVGCSLDESREILIKNNWNIKKILEEI